MKRLEIIIFFIIILLCGCGNINEEQEITNEETNTQDYPKLYFKQGHKLVTINDEDINNKDHEDATILNHMLMAMKYPQNQEYTSIFPDNLTVKSFILNTSEHIVEIDLSTEYYDMSLDEGLMFRAGLTKAFTSLKIIDGIRITVEGAPVLNSSGQSLGVLTQEDVIIDTDKNLFNKEESFIITLYFWNKEEQLLEAEVREVKLNKGNTLPRKVFQELLAGPQNAALSDTIPEGTQLRDIFVKDGIAYVDFNRKFVTNHEGGETAEIMTLFSIVNSLTELNNINQVQFLISGKKQKTFKTRVNFDNLFSRNLDLVKKD